MRVTYALVESTKNVFFFGDFLLDGVDLRLRIFYWTSGFIQHEKRPPYLRWPRKLATHFARTSREVNEARSPRTCSRPCAFEEKKTGGKKTQKNPAAPKTHHEIHSSPANKTTSKRHATKQVPRVSPYLPASIDFGFVEIGLVQLSQSVKKTNVTHTLTDTQKQSD